MKSRKNKPGPRGPHERPIADADAAYEHNEADALTNAKRLDEFTVSYTPPPATSIARAEVTAIQASPAAQEIAKANEAARAALAELASVYRRHAKRITFITPETLAEVKRAQDALEDICSVFDTFGFRVITDPKDGKRGRPSNEALNVAMRALMRAIPDPSPVETADFLRRAGFSVTREQIDGAKRAIKSKKQ